MGATLTDIAKATQTSVSTVSRVLAGGAAAARISEATRKKVVEEAKRQGYRPNLVARSLRTRRSQTVALLVSDIANPWFGVIASRIESNLHKHDYSLVLCNSGEDPLREQEYLRLLPSKGIDGLILVPLLKNKKQLADLLPSKLPVVLLDRPIQGVSAAVWTDPEQMAAELCDALQRAGVKKVVLVTGPQHVTTHKRRREIVASRFEVVAEHEGPGKKETGREAFMKFLGLEFDAVVCTNNFLGHGVIDSMVDVENPPIVACFDEIPNMHLLPIPMVCSVQDVDRLAEGCVNQLLLLLKGQEEPKPVILPARALSNMRFDEMTGRGA